MKAPASEARTRQVGASAGVDIDYLNRMADFADRTDLVASGGRDAEEIRTILSAVDDTTIRRNGRIALTLTMELPRELDQTAWIRIADTLANDLEETGRPTHWVIHCDPAAHNPHIHLVAAARPVRDGRVTREGVRGRPAEEPIIWNTKEKVREQRRRAANIVNHELDAAGLDYMFHPGRLADTGLVRDPKRRVPARAWYKDGQRDRDPQAVATARAHHTSRRERAANRTSGRIRTGQKRTSVTFQDIARTTEQLESSNFEIKDPSKWIDEHLIAPIRIAFPRERHDTAKALMGELLAARESADWPKGRELKAFLKDTIAPLIRVAASEYPAPEATAPSGTPTKHLANVAKKGAHAAPDRDLLHELQQRNAHLQEELLSLKTRTADEMPATTKQLNYLNDLLKKTKSSLPDSDDPLTQGQVGTWIRELQKRLTSQRERSLRGHAGFER